MRDQFIRQVLSHIKFRFVHAKIRKELSDHLDDSIDEYQELGYSFDESERRAVDAMGDADDIGNALNDVNRPLTKILSLTSKMLGFITVITVVFVTVGPFIVGNIKNYMDYQDTKNNYISTVSIEGYVQSLEGISAERFEDKFEPLNVGSYTVSVPDYYIVSDKNENKNLVMFVKLSRNKWFDSYASMPDFKIGSFLEEDVNKDRGFLEFRTVSGFNESRSNSLMNIYNVYYVLHASLEDDIDMSLSITNDYGIDLGSFHIKETVSDHE